ncbi:ABC transporter permease [Salibacterium aidingense]|uniref:ABC transporter permease n=1 Tax=Salibacterium aidingense TaxID=384933 RepID=UPI0004065C09|nr:ABC transporter permease [Salibacterium aidingense]
MSMSSAEAAKKEMITSSKKGTKGKYFGVKFMNYFLGPIIAFIIFAALWQTVPLLIGMPHYIFPKPTDVINAAVSDWSLLRQAVQITVLESVIGFLLSAVIGIIVSIILASSKIIERSIYPYAIILQTLPVVAVAPIVVIWFGAGFNAIVVVAFLIGFFPVISNTLMGLNSVDKEMDDLFSLYNASKWQKMWKLRIPSAMPFIMAGLKISCTLSIVGAIVGEYVAGVGGGEGGLGYAITVSAIQVNTSFIFACAIAGAVLGVSFYLLVNLVSNKILGSWHESAMKKEQ